MMFCTYIGSGFKSVKPFRSGYFGASIKLQPGYTAGVITAFYVRFFVFSFTYMLFEFYKDIVVFRVEFDKKCIIFERYDMLLLKNQSNIY